MGTYPRAMVAARASHMTLSQWLSFIQDKLLVWTPVAAILGVIAYEALFE